MGESRIRKLAALSSAEATSSEPLVLDTFGGRLHVKFDDTAGATVLGQLPFFVEFLQHSGLYERWVNACPLVYASPNAPRVENVLGTLFLASLSGCRRYSHINGLRGDGVSPGILGMTKLVSDDSLSRALGAMDEARADAWIAEQLHHVCGPLLATPWILDIDTTIKPLYGKQEGATVGYNPHKPGRPSHAYHSYLMSEQRLVLDVAVSPGHQMSSKHALPGLAAVLERCALTPAHKPRLVRGDCGFGNEATLALVESHGIDYLFRLRQTANVKKLIARCFFKDSWVNAGCGYEAFEVNPDPTVFSAARTDSTLKLSGWSRSRRVVILRRRVADIDGALLAHNDTGQLTFLDDVLHAPHAMKLYEYVVLVTSLGREGYELCGIAQLYRDRADCENSFDELKNQWGWTGFTSQEMKRSSLMARNNALIYNWWSLFMRAAHPGERLEAITSRPLMLTAVGRKTEHAGQSHLLITCMHVAKARAIEMLSNVHALLQRLKTTTAQLRAGQRWAVIADEIVRQILALKPKPIAVPAPVFNG